MQAVYHGVRALDHNGSDTEKIKTTWDGSVGIFPGETRHERVQDNWIANNTQNAASTYVDI